MEIELTLVWAIIVTITLGIIMTFLIRLQKRHDQDIRDKEIEIQDMNNEIQDVTKKLNTKQTKAWQSGVNVTAGDYSQILGDFALLSKYDSIITLSTTSSQPSLDLIGINAESIDFLELKKKGAGSTKNEMHVKRLVNENKVDYKIYDVDLPDNFSINERTQKEPSQKEQTKKDPIRKKLTREERFAKYELQKIEARKKDASAYEPWTNTNDEFLINYWNDESNKRNRDEMIRELAEKLRRSNGGIKARLKRKGLIE